MLYQIYETQRSLIEPLTDFAEAASKLYSNPLSPLSHGPLAQRIAAGYDLMYRLGKDYVKPVFGINQIDVDGVGIAIHERVEIDKPFCELRRFKRFCDDSATLTKLKGQPVVLLVAPLSGHYATLLRDTVNSMLKDHKVYITDWKNARNVPMSEGEFHLDDYVNYIQEFIRHLQAHYGNCHVISVCQPTVPVLAAVSLMASRGETTPLSMTMMGGPIDATRCPTSVNTLATNRSIEWFENNVIYRVPPKFPGAGRRVYPGFLQYAGFVAMNPDRHASSHYDYFKNMVVGDDASTEAHRKFYDEYNAVLDMDADYYLETIETVFQEFRLVKGTWDVKSPSGKVERVKPQDIKTTGLLTVEGELDDISGSGQTKAAHDLCTNIPREHSRHFQAMGAGHYGIFSGRRWREVVYPQVKAFIKAHQSAAPEPDKQPAANVAASVIAANTSPADTHQANQQPITAQQSKAKSTPKPIAQATFSNPANTAHAAPIKPTSAALSTSKKSTTPVASSDKKTAKAASTVPVATRWVGEVSAPKKAAPPQSSAAPAKSKAPSTTTAVNRKKAGAGASATPKPANKATPKTPHRRPKPAST